MALLSRISNAGAPSVRSSLTAAPATRRQGALLLAASPALMHPPAARIGAGPCPGRRNLHVGAAIGETIRSTADTFSWMHDAVGIPWFVTIPLIAVAVNVTFRFPLQLYAARMREQRKEVNPLLTAWARKHAAIIAREQPSLPDRVKNLRVAGAVERTRRRIYKDWGCQRWKGFVPLLSIFPFLTISEALRRKCGAPVGWISNSVGLGSGDGGATAGAAAGLFDPSLAQGGALWFTDLTSMDPYFGLPILCTAILGYSTWGKMGATQLRELLSLQSDPSKVTLMTRLQKAIGRTMLLVPVMPLLFADLPSAIFLYWASSFALTNVNDIILTRLVPKKKHSLTSDSDKILPPYVREKN